MESKTRKTWERFHGSFGYKVKNKIFSGNHLQYTQWGYIL